MLPTDDRQERRTPAVDAGVLDRAAWAALTGPHARFAETYGQATRYMVDVSPFGAISPDHDEGVWSDLIGLVGAGQHVLLTGTALTPPAGWAVVGGGDGLQMVAEGLETAEDPETVRLGGDDVPAMLDLVERTKPGPFRPRTVELGNYLGIKRDGRLIAMAGERLHPPGWTEISAVCTDDDYRGQGLATRLVRAVAAGIEARGERSFLHVAENNTGAIRLYEDLGFVVHQRRAFQVLRTPSEVSSP